MPPLNPKTALATIATLAVASLLITGCDKRREIPEPITSSASLKFVLPAGTRFAA